MDRVFTGGCELAHNPGEESASPDANPGRTDIAGGVSCADLVRLRGVCLAAALVRARERVACAGAAQSFRDLYGSTATAPRIRTAFRLLKLQPEPRLLPGNNTLWMLLAAN